MQEAQEAQEAQEDQAGCGQEGAERHAYPTIQHTPKPTYACTVHLLRNIFKVPTTRRTGSIRAG